MYVMSPVYTDVCTLVG